MKRALIIVSGLPRSGTSMLMKMLEAGGVEIVTDNLRKPDHDNPKGYYEYEKVKQLQKDSAWLYTMHGKAIKVISFLLYHLPVSLPYKVLFMQRNMQEILTSQKKMLDRLGQQNDTVSDSALAQKFETHLQKITKWITTQKNMDCLSVNYNKILEDPATGASEIQHFLQQPLNIENMVSAVDPSLYRNRA
jgi:hypothetical protein